MFAAFGRLIRAIMYSFSGHFEYWAEIWGTSPAAIKAQYAAIEKSHTARIQEVKRAVAGIMKIKDEKEDRLKVLDTDVVKLNRLIQGAMAMAQKRVQVLQGQGMSLDDIKLDIDYVKCSTAFKDFSSTVTAKTEEATRLHDEIEGHDKQLTGYEASLMSMVRELGSIRQEGHETAADIQIARQEKEANDLIAGISQDRTGEDRQKLQDMRRRLRSEAKVSQKLAGIDSKNQEQEFLDYALTSAASTEFDKLVGLTPAQQLIGISEFDKLVQQPTIELQQVLEATSSSNTTTGK